MSRKEMNGLSIFTQKGITHEDIVGEKYTVTLYAGNKGKSIDKLRYEIYNRAIKNSKDSNTFKLESLPPTSAALKQHSFHVYHASEWGWAKKKSILWPTMSDMKVAPERFLKLISGGCKTGCQKSTICS